MTREELDEIADDVGEPILVADGFDDCILGVTEASPKRAVYSCNKMVEKIASQVEKEWAEEPEGHEGEDAWSEAYDYLSFNTWGAYVGEHTPLYIWESRE